MNEYIFELTRFMNEKDYNMLIKDSALRNAKANKYLEEEGLRDERIENFN